MKVNAYILLGGMVGNLIDAPADVGMYQLQEQLNAIQGVRATTTTWGEWQDVIADMNRVVIRRPHEAIAIIGYSGGGSRATWLATSTKMLIDLMVLYDPSPKGQMKPINGNVMRAVCYHNTNPMMFDPIVGELGGGVLTKTSMNVSTKMVTVDIAVQHLAVQLDQSLHDRTIEEVKALVLA